MRLSRPTLALAFALTAMTGAASAQEAYVRAGTTGLGIGYAHSIDGRWGVRGEFSTLGSIDRNGNTEGIDFTAKLKADQVAVYGDFFPMRGGFRLTAGLSSNRYTFSGVGNASGAGTITINTTTIPFGPADSVSVEGKYSSVTPYLGIGYGHGNTGKGFGFVADLGAYIGKWTSSTTVSPSVQAKLSAAGVNADAEIAAQNKKIQDNLDKIGVLPLVSVGVSYRW